MGFLPIWKMFDCRASLIHQLQRSTSFYGSLQLLSAFHLCMMRLHNLCMLYSLFSNGSQNVKMLYMLIQLGEKHMDLPISYDANTHFNLHHHKLRRCVNYLSSVKKFCHYLLENHFFFFITIMIFYIKWKNLVQLDKLYGGLLSCYLAKGWFHCSSKKGSTHQRANHMSRITTR